MKTAVITGATKGIGKAIASLFLEKGIDIIICSRNKQELFDLKKVWNDRFPERNISVIVCDVSKKEEVLAFADFVKSITDHIDILVNNAGVFIPGAIHDEKDGAIEQMIETNLYSAYYLTRALMTKMMELKKGHIVNMCSIASKIAYPNGGSYSISKFALLGLSKVLRKELKPYNVSVTSILPGATWSNSWAGVDLPDERLMQAEDIAKAVYSSYELAPSAVVEEIILRPALGDL